MKKEQLKTLMDDVANCSKCIDANCGIAEKKRLHNFIAEYPHSPHYGGVPNPWTDWSSRVNSKIMLIGQDWGAESGEIGTTSLRHKFLNAVKDEGSAESVWNRMNIHLGLDATRTVQFFKESARLEQIGNLPDDFMKHLYLTNSVLCVRRGEHFSGYENLDVRRSIQKCREFLLRQIEIVKPIVIVTLGSWPLWALDQIGSESLGKRIAKVQSSGHGYIEQEIKGNLVAIVPTYHHAARPLNRTLDEQIADYRYVWKALKNHLNQTGEEIIRHCFPET